MHVHTLPGLPAASRICLGAATYGTIQQSEELAFAMLDDFVAAGGNFVDTAHIYAAWLPFGAGAPERALGRWMRARGQRLIVGTKGGHPPLDNMAMSRLNAGEISRDCNESLERLQIPTIDLYWLHRDDERVPVGEIIDACQPLVRSGRVRALGASNWRWQRIAEANAWAAAHGATGFIASQLAWSLAETAPGFALHDGTRWVDAETVAWHRTSGVAQIPYSSQANGFFAKPLTPHARYTCPANTARWQRVQMHAARLGISPNALALSWLLHHPSGGWAIVGCRDRAQLADSLTADALRLDADVMADLTRGADGS